MKTTDIGVERFPEDFYADPNTAFIKMRDATPEEQQTIQKNIDKISKPTGINFNDYLNRVLEDDDNLRKEYDALEEKYKAIEKELKAKQCIYNDSWDDVGTGCFAYWDKE